MNKTHISFVFLASLILISSAGAVVAQEEPATVATEEAISISDLGVEEPTILPTSPFYFFKEFGRNVRSLVTFNSVSKAELELKFANEKAAELKKVSDTQPQNTEAIQKALKNYQNTQEKLQQRFEKLSETSQNPKVDTLLNNLTDRVVKHEKLFDEISFKFKEKEGIADAISGVMTGSENVIGEASKKDDAAKFSSRLEKVLLEEKGGDLKHARSVEIIDRFSGKATVEAKESLGRLREEFSDRLKSDIEDLLEEEGEDVLKEKIANTPGDLSKRSVIIEEIQKRAEQRVSEAIGKAVERLEEFIKKEADTSQKAREQIERARKMIQEAQEKNGVSDLLTEAKDHLKDAESALQEEKFGEAFGQARSAEVLARNAIKFIERQKPETENFEQHIKELAEKIKTYENLLKERNFTREQNKEAFELLDNAVLHLGYARDAFVKADLAGTKLHMGHVKDFLSKLSRLIEIRQIRSDEKPTILPTTQIRKVEEKTENEIEIEVETEKPESVSTERTTVKPIAPTTNVSTAVREFKIEADDSGFYPEPSIRVKKGSKVKLTFFVRSTNVYFGGLEMKSNVFKTGTIKPGGSASVEFTANESFEFTSWWPLSNVKKQTGKVIVE